MARRIGLIVVVVLCLTWLVAAQAPAQNIAPSSLAANVSVSAQKHDEAAQLKASVDELKALVFALQTKLAAVEKELGEEKARRAALEIAELQRARETLEPSVKRKLGLPVPDTPTPDQKPVTPQTPPK